jgi:type I restriction enzyme, S subunit
LNESLPSSWTWAKGEDLFSFIRGVSYDKANATSQSGEGRVAILRAGNLQDGRIKFEDLVFVPPKYVREEQLLKRGDLVIAMSSGSASVVGKVAVAQDDYSDFSFGAFCGLLRPETADLGNWLAHYFQTKSYRSEISRASAGININNIKREHLLEPDIPLAPLNELRRIVAKLQALLGRVDACRKQLEQVPHLLKQFRQSVLSAACSGDLTNDSLLKPKSAGSAEEFLENVRFKRFELWKQAEIAKRKGKTSPSTEEKLKAKYPKPREINKTELPEIPEHWSWASLDEICYRLTYGITVRPKYVSDGIPLISAREIRLGQVDLTKANRISQEDYENLREKCKIYQSDVLFSKTGTVGSVARVKISQPLCSSQNIAVISPLIDSAFLELILRSPAIQKRAAEAITQTAVGDLQLGFLAQFPIPIPPLWEQREIASRVEALFKIADAVEDRYRKAQEQLDKLPQAILAKAFRGDLVPQDPTDEPASALLERIRAAKAGSGKPARKTRQPPPKSKQQQANPLPFTTAAEG